MRAQAGRPSVRAPRGRGAKIGLLIAGIIAMAFNLRGAITSLPPLFPEMAGTLHLSSAALGLLAAVPVLCFGVFSPVAAPLSRRLGEERVLGWALVLLVAGLAMRGGYPAVLLFPGTVLAMAAVALMNVLLPSLIKRRHPGQAGLLLGMYLMSLCGGAIIGALIAVPVFTDAGGGGWATRLSLGLWALPALLAVTAWLPQTRFRVLPGQAEPGQGGAEPAGLAGHGVLAMVRFPLAWQVTLFMGLQSLFYYSTLSWFPTLFRDRGASAVEAGNLLALMNLGNAITALAVPMLAHRARDQRGLVIAALAADAVGLAGAVFGPLGSAPALVLVLGLGQGATLALGIFFTMARAPDPVTAASLSAFAQGIGYLLASAGPLLVGVLHAVTGSWTVPMLALLGTVGLQLVTGWLAGRNMTLPGPVART